MYLEKYSDEDYYGPKPIAEIRDNIINNILEDMNVIDKRWIPADMWHYDYNQEDYDPWYAHKVYNMRNYIFFSLLSGVREHTISGIKICDPRGVPNDASYAYKKKVEYWDIDGHSHSYFTLKELYDVDFEKKIDENKHLYGLRDSVYILKNIMEKMALIEENPEYIRMCFFFDN